MSERAAIRRRAVRAARRRGLTLIELVLSVALFSIFMVAVYDTVIAGLRVADAANEREAIRQDLVGVLDQIVREINVADGVDTATSSEFQFDTASVNNVEYLYDSTDGVVTRDDGSSAQRTVLRNVTSFDFDYVLEDGTEYTGSSSVPGSDEDDVRVVRISVTVADDAESITMTSAAYVRNL